MVRSDATISNACFIIDHIGYHVESSEFELKLKRNLGILEQAEAREPSNAYVLFCLGATYGALGRKEQCLAVLERVLTQAGASNLLQAMTLNTITRVYLAEKAYAKIIELATKSLSVLPNQNTAHYFLGVAHYGQEDYAQALPHLLCCHEYSCRPIMERSTGLSQEYTMNEMFLHKSLAISLFQNGDYSRAIDIANMYLLNNDQDAECYYIIALSLYNLGNYETALHNMNKAILHGLNYNLLRITIALSLLKICKIEDSIDHLISEDEYDEYSIAQAYELIYLIIQENSNSFPLDSLLQAKKRLIENGSFEQLGMLVSLLARFGHINALKCLFEICRNRQRELQTLIVGVINFFHAQNRLSELLVALNALVNEYPAHLGYLDACGTIHIKQGNLFRAIDTYHRIHHLSPENAHVRRTLAGLYASVGKEAQALQLLRGVSHQ
jgi:tetratricopeptide (TPR) repeat protein